MHTWQSIISPTGLFFVVILVIMLFACTYNILYTAVHCFDDHTPICVLFVAPPPSLYNHTPSPELEVEHVPENRTLHAPHLRNSGRFRRMSADPAALQQMQAQLQAAHAGVNYHFEQASYILPSSL